MHEADTEEQAFDGEEGGQRERNEKADESHAAEKVHGARGKAQQERDGDEIEEDGYDAADAVVRSTVFALGDVNRDFTDAGSVRGGESGNETNELAVNGDLLDEIAAQSFEAAAKVVNGNTAGFSHQAVGDQRGDLFEEQAIAGALHTAAADDVESLFELFDEGGNVLRIVLQVSIHADDVLAFGLMKAGDQGFGAAVIAAEVDDRDAFVAIRQFAQEGRRAVRASVVDEDKLEVVSEGLHDGFGLHVQFGDVPFLIVKRNDDAVLHRD